MDDEPIADARKRVRRVFVRDLALVCRIGVDAAERRTPQRLLVNLDLAVTEGQAPARDELADVVDYAALVERVRAVAARVEVKLLETLAERIAEACFFDSRVREAWVRIEKPGAIADAASVGIEIHRLCPASLRSGGQALGGRLSG